MKSTTPSNTMHLGAPKEVFEKARLLRTNETKHESKLWKVLRPLRPQGFHFRRQHPIGQYVVDFYCHSAKMIIEVDGPDHSTKRVKQNDQQKEEFFHNHGIRVIRFTNKQVDDSLELLVSKIKLELGLDKDRKAYQQPNT